DPAEPWPGSLRQLVALTQPAQAIAEEPLIANIEPAEHTLTAKLRRTVDRLMSGAMPDWSSWELYSDRLRVQPERAPFDLLFDAARIVERDGRPEVVSTRRACFAGGVPGRVSAAIALWQREETRALSVRSSERARVFSARGPHHEQ